MMLQNFIDYLEARARIRAAYVWGGQGERGLTDAQIRRMESTEVNAQRVIKYRNKLIAEGMAPEAIEYYDCSGIGIRYLKDILRVLSYDTTADGLMGFCESLRRDQLRRGDWVFRVYASGAKKGRAYHIGYIVDDALNVVEAKGRDEGVVKRPINASGPAYWNAYGRPSFFRAEIIAVAPVVTPAPVIDRVIKLTSPNMRGDDVRQLQQMLTDAGYPCGAIDGVYGPMTAKAHADWKNPNYSVVVACYRLNVREEPSNTSKILKVLKTGEKLKIAQEQKPWGKLADQPGWIHLGYTNKL